jgi:hypothetical protein
MHGLVHLGLVSFRYLGDYCAVRGINVGKLARAGHESAANIILDSLHKVPGGLSQS